MTTTVELLRMRLQRILDVGDDATINLTPGEATVLLDALDVLNLPSPSITEYLEAKDGDDEELRALRRDKARLDFILSGDGNYSIDSVERGSLWTRQDIDRAIEQHLSAAHETEEGL